MSIHRLREIYSFAGLEFSLQADKLMELKGVMLLNLKSSADGKIDINGTTYTKNDLLNIFSQEYTEESFDINTVLSKYPGLKELQKRGGISTNFSGDIDALKAESTFLEIRDYFTEHHYMDYYRCIREDIRETRLKPAADKISYMFIFTDDVLINFKAALKSDILAILREQITTKKGHYFTLWAPYYTILNHIAYDDEDFLLEQFNLIIEKVNRPSVDEAETFFRRQLSLNFSDYVKAQIRE